MYITLEKNFNIIAHGQRDNCMLKRISFLFQIALVKHLQQMNRKIKGTIKKVHANTRRTGPERTRWVHRSSEVHCTSSSSLTNPKVLTGYTTPTLVTNNSITITVFAPIILLPHLPDRLCMT